MRSLKSYIENLKFDKIESYKINKGKNISCNFKNNYFLIFDNNGNILPNGILDSKNKINSQSELVSTILDENIITKFKTLFKEFDERHVNFEKPLFKIGLLLYDNNKVVDALNFSFKQGIIKSNDGTLLLVSKSDFEKLRLFFYQDLKHELFESANYYGNVLSNWKNFQFPNSYTYNPLWNNYETTIITPILVRNYNSVKVEIETEGKEITQEQINRLKYIQNYSINLKKEMFRKIFEVYNYMREDYELPEIKDNYEDMLPFFVKLEVINVPLDKNDDIELSFSCWDEEHGLLIMINEQNNKIEIE